MRRRDREIRQAEQEAWRLNHRSDGKPYPPANRGMCDRCQRAAEKIYYLPEPLRLCEDCYMELYRAGSLPDQQAVESPTGER